MEYEKFQFEQKFSCEISLTDLSHKKNYFDTFFS